MKIAAVAIAGLATVAHAAAPGAKLTCHVNTANEPYPFAYLRPTPCNTQAPLATMYQGDTVMYTSGTAFKYGCNHSYAKVTLVRPGMKSVTGYMDSHYLDCGSQPAPPQCTSDNQCALWQACEGHMCVSVHCNESCSDCEHGVCKDPAPRCGSDDDCYSNYACEGGMCVLVHCDECDASQCVHGQCLLQD